MYSSLKKGKSSKKSKTTKKKKAPRKLAPPFFPFFKENNIICYIVSAHGIVPSKNYPIIKNFDIALDKQGRKSEHQYFVSGYDKQNTKMVLKPEDVFFDIPVPISKEEAPVIVIRSVSNIFRTFTTTEAKIKSGSSFSTAEVLKSSSEWENYLKLLERASIEKDFDFLALDTLMSHNYLAEKNKDSYDFHRKSVFRRMTRYLPGQKCMNVGFFFQQNEAEKLYHEMAQRDYHNYKNIKLIAKLSSISETSESSSENESKSSSSMPALESISNSKKKQSSSSESSSEEELGKVLDPSSIDKLPLGLTLLPRNQKFADKYQLNESAMEEELKLAEKKYLGITKSGKQPSAASLQSRMALTGTHQPVLEIVRTSHLHGNFNSKIDTKVHQLKDKNLKKREELLKRSEKNMGNSLLMKKISEEHNKIEKDEKDKISKLTSNYKPFVCLESITKTLSELETLQAKLENRPPKTVMVFVVTCEARYGQDWNEQEITSINFKDNTYKDLSEQDFANQRQKMIAATARRKHKFSKKLSDLENSEFFNKKRRGGQPHGDGVITAKHEAHQEQNKMSLRSSTIKKKVKNMDKSSLIAFIKNKKLSDKNKSKLTKKSINQLRGIANPEESDPESDESVEERTSSDSSSEDSETSSDSSKISKSKKRNTSYKKSKKKFRKGTKKQKKIKMRQLKTRKKKIPNYMKPTFTFCNSIKKKSICKKHNCRWDKKKGCFV